ncbi:MAG: bacillithiol biosynthesis deacetylase BshB1 [Planctomycetota bacterium]
MSAAAKVDLLVIAAHPDDAEIGAGGILLLLRKQGFRTGVLDLTHGELSSRGDLATRARETATATQLLDLSWRGQLDCGDGRVRDTDAARAQLVGVVRELRPQVVLAPWKDDWHPDHAGAGQLALRSWYLCGVGKYAPGAPPFRPARLGYYMCHDIFEPSIVVDVGAVWEQKMLAVRAFASQFFQPGVAGPPTKISSPHFLAAIEGRAREFGTHAGAEFGEPLRWERAPLVRSGAELLGGDVKSEVVR